MYGSDMNVVESARHRGIFAGLLRATFTVGTMRKQESNNFFFL